MHGTPFHKSLIDQANSVKIPEYSKKSKCFDPIDNLWERKWPNFGVRVEYVSVPSCNNKQPVMNTMYNLREREGLRGNLGIIWRFLIFFRKVVHKWQPTKLGFSSPLLNTTTWLWTFTSTWHLNIVWKRLYLLRCKQISFPYSTRDKYLQGTQKAFTGLCLSLNHSICLTIEFKLNLSFENCYNTYETHSSE